MHEVTCGHHPSRHEVTCGHHRPQSHWERRRWLRGFKDVRSTCRFGSSHTTVESKTPSADRSLSYRSTTNHEIDPSYNFVSSDLAPLRFRRSFRCAKSLGGLELFELARNMSVAEKVDSTTDGLVVRDLEGSPSLIDANMDEMGVGDTHSTMQDRQLQRTRRTQALIEALEKRDCAEHISFEVCRKFVAGRSHWASADQLADEIQACAYYTRWTSFAAFSARCFEHRERSAKALHSSNTDDPLSVAIAQFSDDAVIQAARELSLRKLVEEKTAVDDPAITSMPTKVRKLFDEVKTRMGDVCG